MVPSFDTTLLNTLGNLIGKIERFQLEGAIPEEFDPRDLLDEEGQAFFHIRGLADFWSRDTTTDFGQYMNDLVIGAHNQHRADLTMIMLGTPRKLAIYLSLGSEDTTRTILEGMFPGIQLEPVATKALSALLCTHLVINGVITGIPSRKGFGTGSDATGESQQGQNAPPSSSRKGGQAQLERVVRGMYGATWAYVVQAHPRPRHNVVEDRMETIDLLTQVTNRSRTQWQSTKQDNQQFSTIESGGTSQTFSGDMVNHRAQYLINLLQRELERHDQAMAAGQWTVNVYFGANDANDAGRLSSLLLGILAGADSRPEPLRTAFCQREGQSLESFCTFLTSSELSTLIQLPREETAGYALHDYVHFDIDFPELDSEALPLGAIQQNGRSTLETFDISLDALTKHVVVIGVTGSGKTTTVMNLIDRVVEANKPFLVIEPAKTEYRSLHSALAPRVTLHVYTLGNEMVAPFRLNPFEFETDDEPGSASLLTHIDFLKAVFNAAFVLYAPMPQVLEEALHEVYEDKGWDLTSGTNRRLPNWSERHQHPIFPTLTDLYYKVEEVTNRLGYDKEVESNVKAGLKSRIGSLRIGSKGLMLDTARGVPMAGLLSTPTILELENIGSDDEKTFLMGLFLARLYEFRRLQFATGNLPKGLQHLIVFEEAHRLLKNTSTQVDSESANPRAQAIEVFTNMLSEVRAYGQGVLVAEQIPSKLAPDVLKNTNLKIVHRLIAKDDRESIGQTMNLNDDQQTHLGTLTPGMAAVYAEGADHAYLVRLENYKRKISPLPEAKLKQMSRQYASVKAFQAILDLQKYDVPHSPSGGPDPAAYHAASKLLDAEKSRWLWSNLLLRSISRSDNLLDILLRFSEHTEGELSYLPPNQQDAIMRMVFVKGSAEMMHMRGAQFGWSYPQVDEIRVLLTRGLLYYAQFYGSLITLQKSDQQEREEQERIFDEMIVQIDEIFQDFQNHYLTLTKRRQGPFAGCIHCPARCHYHSDVNLLLTKQNQEWVMDELTSRAYETNAARYQAVAEAATRLAQSWLGEKPGSPTSVDGQVISYCAVLHVIARPNFNDYEQGQIANDVLPYITGQKDESA